MSGIELNYEGMDNHKPYLFELGHVVMTAGLSAWAEESFPPALLRNRAWATALMAHNRAKKGAKKGRLPVGNLPFFCPAATCPCSAE